RGVGSFAFDQLPAHRFTERHDPVGLVDQETIGPIKNAVDHFTLKILQEPGYLGENVAKGHDETSAVAAGSEVCGKADDRRVRERNHHVRLVEMKTPIACAQEITHIVAESSRESPLGKSCSASADDF